MTEDVYENYIVDRYFIETYKKMSGEITKHLGCYIFRASLLAVTMPINHFVFEEGKNEKISVFSYFLIGTLAVSLAQITIFSYLYFTRVKNRQRITKIAQDLQHAKQVDSLKSFEREDSDQMVVFYQVQDTLKIKISSSYYDFQNMEKINQVSDQHKVMREANGMNLIRVALEKDVRCFKVIQRILQVCSAFIIVSGFVIGSVVPISQIQHSLLQIVLISEVIIKPRVFTILMIICLVPIIIALLCIYICCCKQRIKQAKLPEIVQVTSETMSKCSECSICFQDFAIGEQINILPCAQSHIFHHACIEGWTKIKPNCPICRSQLTE